MERHSRRQMLDRGDLDKMISKFYEAQEDI